MARLLFLVACVACVALAGAQEESPLRAHYLVTVADDFVVEIYHNGKQVPDAQREMTSERFGATSEKITLEVRQGDWLVFHVVNNRLRWGGAYYFGLAGCMAHDEITFVSAKSSAWSACDDPGSAPKFIAERRFMAEATAKEVSQPWGEGDGRMKVFAGPSWSGAPIWGTERSTWLKLQVP